MSVSPHLRNLAPVLSSLVLSSCILGPEPGSPGLKVPSSIRGDASHGGTSFGDHSWRKVFTDPTLRSLIDEALRNNPDLAAATYRIDETRALAGQARASWFPIVSGNAGTSLNYGSVNAGQAAPGGERESDSYNLTGLLSWEADLWGGIHRSNQAARANLLAAEYQRDAVRTSLIAAVATSYIQLQNLDERLAIARRTAGSRKSSLDLVTARLKGGVTSTLESGQAESLLAQANVAIPVTEQAIAAKENEIRALLGRYPGSVARSGSMDRLLENLKVTGGLPSELLTRRPDLAAADQSFQAATAQIGVAESLRLPSLALTGSGGVISGDLSNLLRKGSTTYSIGPDLAGPIFDAGLAKFGAKAARARAETARAEYESAAKQAFREAADALDAWQKTRAITAGQAELVRSLDTVSTTAKDRFVGDASSYLEVLDAERNLFTAELQLADARRDQLLSVVRAYRALGGGWK